MSSQADVVAPQLAGDGAYGTSWRPPLLIAEGHGAQSSKATAADECALALCAQAAGSSLSAQTADQRQLLDVEAPQESITLLFSKAVEGFGAGKSISVNVLPDDSVKEVRVRLKREGLLPSASQQCLFVGDRQLMDEDLIRDVLRRCPKSADVGLRHIFIRLADIERFDLQTATKGWSVQLEQQSRSTEDLPTTKPVMSALAASLQRTGSEPALNGGRPMEEGAVTVRGQIIPERASITTYVSPTTLSSSNGLIHLVVRRGALVRQAVSEDNIFELTVHATDTTASIQQRLFLQEGWGEADKHQLVLHRGDGKQLPLLPGKSLAEYGVDSGQGALLELIPLLEPRDAFQFPDGSPLLSSPLHGLFPHFQEARKGLSRGQKPQLASAGSGGSYFLSGSNGHRVAVFKPFDEEPNAVNNPRGSPTSDESMRAGVMPGEGAIREVAAYVLDHDSFAGVPPTALVECVASDGRATAAGSPSKVGSLQQFVASDFDCEEHGTSAFPVAEVHKIAVLDIRLANTDRNGGNILARRLRPPAGGWGGERRESGGAGEEWQLIPIDHGCCLPSCFEDITFEWMYWPQAQQPFSQDTLDYIAELDWQKDLRILEAQQLYLRPECRRVLCTSTMLLKKCAALGLTPGDIASIMCRETVHRSAMEKMHSCTLEILEREAESEQDLPPGALVVQGAKAPEAAAAADLHAYLRVMADVMDDYLATLVAVKAATEAEAR